MPEAKCLFYTNGSSRGSLANYRWGAVRANAGTQIEVSNYSGDKVQQTGFEFLKLPKLKDKSKNMPLYYNQGVMFLT